MAANEMTADALAWLQWYRAMGVDAALGEAPVDWLARGPIAPGRDFVWPADGGQPVTEPTRAPASARPVSAAQHPASRPPPGSASPITLARPQTPLAASEAETEGRRLARQASNLKELETALRSFNGCALKATAQNLCFFRGAPRARIMFIGEAPGRDEDIEGRPFVGRAGQLLDKMLAAIELSEADVHITNIVYWRPPGNRTPTPQEALACRPFLERQMEFVAPEFVVAVGGAAAKEVLNTTEGIMRLRGKWRALEIAGRSVQAIATLHPAYLLRTPAAKQLAWIDLLNIRSSLNERG